jgi:hypothetical protein
MVVLLPDFQGVKDFLLSKKSKKDASRRILIVKLLFQQVTHQNRTTGIIRRTGKEVLKMEKSLQNGRNASLLWETRGNQDRNKGSETKNNFLNY